MSDTRTPASSRETLPQFDGKTELPVELRPQEQEIDPAVEYNEMGDQMWDNSFWEQDLGPDSDYGPEL